MKNKNVTSVILLLQALAFQPAIAGELKTLLPTASCSAEQLASEPMSLRPYLAGNAWNQALSTKEAQDIFEASKLESLKAEANAVRETLSSAHVTQELDRRFEMLRMKAAREAGAGRLNPLLEGKAYARDEFERRQAAQAKFNLENVQPVLEEAYRFYESSYIAREGQRQRAVQPEANAKYLAAVEKQRVFLNRQIDQILPELSSRIGYIPAGTLTASPLSFRDGHIVKIRFELLGQKSNEIKTLTLYPRLLVNQLMGRDQFFIQALETFRDYAKARYEEAFEKKISVRGWLRSLGGRGGPDDETLRVRRGILMSLEADLNGARQVHQLLSYVTDSEILSLLDLFRELEGSNVPKCSGIVSALNIKMQKALSGRGSSADKSFKPEEKAAIDQLAKDIVFFQDIYGALSEASSIVIAKTKAQQSR